jgi:SET domain-containing protein
MLHHKYIEVKNINDKGLGCVARSPIPASFAVEKAHVIIIPSDSLGDELSSYAFDWDDKSAALALGMGSIFNHSQNPNVDYHMENGCIYFITNKPIALGEELTIDYGEDYVESCPPKLRRMLLTSKRRVETHLAIKPATLGLAKSIRFYKA